MFAVTVFKNMLNTPIRLYLHPIPIKLGLDPVSLQRYELTTGENHCLDSDSVGSETF